MPARPSHPTRHQKTSDRRSHRTQERPVVIENVYEQVLDQLLSEAIKEEEFQAGLDIIKKLQRANFEKISTLDTAKERAIKDVEEAMAGKKQGMMRRIAGFFKDDSYGHKLFDAIHFTLAINDFFRQLGQLAGVKAKGKLDSKLVDVLGPRENFEKLVKNAIKSEKGITLSRLTRTGSDTWIRKYLGNDLRSLATELEDMTVKEFADVARSVLTVLKDVDKEAKEFADAGKEVADKGSKKEDLPEQGDLIDDMVRTRKAITKYINDKKDIASEDTISKLVNTTKNMKALQAKLDEMDDAEYSTASDDIKKAMGYIDNWEKMSKGKIEEPSQGTSQEAEAEKTPDEIVKSAQEYLNQGESDPKKLTKSLKGLLDVINAKAPSKEPETKEPETKPVPTAAPPSTVQQKPKFPQGFQPKSSKKKSSRRR